MEQNDDLSDFPKVKMKRLNKSLPLPQQKKAQPHREDQAFSIFSSFIHFSKQHVPQRVLQSALYTDYSLHRSNLLYDRNL